MELHMSTVLPVSQVALAVWMQLMWSTVEFHKSYYGRLIFLSSCLLLHERTILYAIIEDKYLVQLMDILQDGMTKLLLSLMKLQWIFMKVRVS